MASQPGQDWSGRELASRLGVKSPNLLTQLAEWTRLGFLSKPAEAGTPYLVRPDRPAPPPTAPDRNPEIATTLLTSRQHGITTRHCSRRRLGALAFAPATAAPTPGGRRKNTRSEAPQTPCVHSADYCSRPVIVLVGQNPSRPSVTAGQPHPSSGLVDVHAKTTLTEPALESRSSQRAGAGTQRDPANGN
jgi:hypothetical protein